MTVTTLDPQSALIVIDLQQGIVSLPTAHPIDGVVKRVRTLADAFRVRRLPVVLVRVAGRPPGRTEQSRVPRALPDDFAELIAELGQQPGDHVVTKHTPGAFTKTDLEAHLRSSNVTQVVVVGVATSSGVEVTARQAYELGFHVTLATDAMTDLDAGAHVYATTRVFPRIGETGTTQQIVDLLGRER